MTTEQTLAHYQEQAQIAKWKRLAERYEYLERNFPGPITTLVHSRHTHGPTSSEMGPAIDAALKGEPK